MTRTVLVLGVGGAATLFFSLVALAGGLLRAPAGWHDWVHRSWSRVLLRLAGVRVRAEGLEHLRPGSPLVLVSNHQSLFDILALFVALPVSLRFIAKRELGALPIFSAAMRQAGHVFIDRDDRDQAILRMQEAGRRMRDEGLALGLFPEGTRSADGRLRSFKKGSFVLAIETGTPLVPIAVEGGAAILPKGRRRIRPGLLEIRCGARIPVAGMTEADRHEITRRSHEAVAALLRELRDRHPAE